jgi:nicotinamidase-related amidase
MAQVAFASLMLDPTQTALLVVDVENEFCHPDGKCFIGDRGIAAVGRLSQLQARCRERGVPIVFVRSVRDPDDLEFTEFGRSPILLRNTWATEYVPDVAPSPAEVVVEKHSHDPFNGTELERRLREMGVAPGAQHTVLVTGVATHVCVACAIIGLSVRNYQPVLVADCAASSTAEQEELAYQLFSGAAYSHNVKLSASDRITFVTEPVLV